ncbi:TPA: DUF551 domain-containing protein [Escherichia coli]|nr:DUF551 domain-containing protein [Escherichia coli]HCS5547545.1 DUF551 domain-containing protein [Escherichia coli]HCS5566077.1 DUF551 domain-containing protein [Escherichia coli]HCS5598886.1 DUF551 domain-containing protein [Escherichia coli]HCS5621482.1 DUF551 domain-containing protein [Escherichia coli]
MTTFTDKELIKEIKERIGSLDVRDNIERRAYEIALASLEAEPVAVNDDMAYAFHHALSDSSLGADEVEEIKAGLRAAFANVTIQPEPVVPDEIALAIETLKQKLVECNRYNYCADAVKGVEDASRVLALQYQNMSTPITPEAIENAIEYIRSIAFHIDEDDYHGKHIAYFMRQALAWLEGHSCSDDRLGKAENQTVHGNQAAESNRGNEWTGNPDIDNAIIMLDRIDTLESCDDDRIEAVKAVLRRLAGNSPVTPDGWVMVPKQVTPEISNAINVVGQRCTCGNCSQRLWDLLLDATQQGVNRG